MNKHVIILPLLLVSATALLMFSLSLPNEEGPEVLASATPTPAPSIASSPSAAATSQPQPSAASSAKPSSTPTGEPSQNPSAEPSPSPSPSSDTLPSYGIAATSPDSVLREAKIHTGRADPFKNVYPPDLPEFATALDPDQMALPAFMGPPDKQTSVTPVMPTFEPTGPEQPEATPIPIAALEEGLVLKGIIDGGIDPIALIEVDGKTELVRVGERLRGNILVTSIHYENKRVTLSRGSQKGLLVIQTPEKTPF